MKIFLNSLPNVEDCKIYLDFGNGYEEFNLSEFKDTGIETPEDCIDFSKIHFKADSSLIKNSTLYNSLYIADECIDLEPNFEKSTIFPDCCFVGEYTIPDGVTSINDYAFRDCTSLTSLIIPNSVTSIGNSAFHNCTSLTSVNIPNSVTSISNSAFRDCTSLESVDISNSVTTIGDSTFSGCSGLTSLIIPDSVNSIGSYTFSACSGLTNITIPSSVTEIKDYAFAYCRNLRTINFTGTEEQWNTISKGENWDSDIPSDCQIVFNYVNG